MEESIVNRIISFLLKKWKTKSGLLIEIIILIAVIGYFYLKTGLVVLIILIPFVIILWFVCWSILSQRTIINPTSKRLILFSFRVEAEAKKQFDRVISKLKDYLVDLNLDNKVRLLVGSEDLITKKQEAVRIREKNNIDLIVWGNTLFGGLKDKKATHFEIHHTFAITHSLKQRLNLFLADITLILQKRSWTIYDINDINDYKIVTDDLFETCLFIIGLYYFDRQNYEDAIKIFEAILSISINKSRIRAEQNIIYIAQTGRINALLIDLYFLRSTEMRDKGDIKSELFYLEKIPEKIQNQIPILMNLAKGYYDIGDLKKAEEYT